MPNPFVPLLDCPRLPEGYAARPPVRSDAPELAALLNAHEQEIGSGMRISLTDFLGDWEGIDLAKDAILVTAADGSIAAYADVSIRGNVLYSVYGYVRPDQRGLGLGTFLVAWGEHRAHDGAIASVPPNARVETRHYVNDKNRPAIALLEALGYRRVRVTYTMVVELDAPPPPPEWPAGIAVRNLVPGEDDEAAYEAFEETFADMWNRPRGTFEEFRARLRRPYFDPAHWFLAMDGGQIAGTLFSDVIDGEGWIETVGVRRPWRNRGLALAMLRHAFAAFYARGVTKVGLSVDAESPTGAPRVYERAGMRLDQTLLVFQRELRPGVALGAAQPA